MTHLAALLIATHDATRLQRWYSAVAGDAGIALLFDERTDLAAQAVEPGRLTLVLRVPDLAAACSRVRRAGTRWTDWTTAADPDGNLVRLELMLPRSGRPGTHGHAELRDASSTPPPGTARHGPASPRDPS